MSRLRVSLATAKSKEAAVHIHGRKPLHTWSTFLLWLCDLVLFFAVYTLPFGFKGAVQFNSNEATQFGGGLAVEGGDVT